MAVTLLDSHDCTRGQPGANWIIHPSVRFVQYISLANWDIQTGLWTGLRTGPWTGLVLFTYLMKVTKIYNLKLPISLSCVLICFCITRYTILYASHGQKSPAISSCLLRPHEIIAEFSVEHNFNIAMSLKNAELSYGRRKSHGDTQRLGQNHRKLK